jgi:hypothetical protein
VVVVAVLLVVASVVVAVAVLLVAALVVVAVPLVVAVVLPCRYLLNRKAPCANGGEWGFS